MLEDDLTFTLDECTEMSRAFDSGNYAHAYKSENLKDFDVDNMSEHERAAFILGFFGTLTLPEIGSDREAFDEAYFSRAGRYVVEVAKYTDDRADEYAAEECNNLDCPKRLDAAACHVDGACDDYTKEDK